MARFLCILAVVVLAMILFVTHEAEGATCKSESSTFDGICINKAPCRKTCIKEKFEDGHCSKLLRRCLCTKPCVFQETASTSADTITKEAKTFAEALLEEDIME